MERATSGSRRFRALAATLAAGTVFGLVGFGAPARASTSNASTVSESSQLQNRRFVVTGDRFYEVGAENATYPGTGWHIRVRGF